MKNNNDTTREDIKHIIGACVCKNDDKTCWYTHNAQEVENDSTVHDNQVNAVLNLILQDRESAVREAKLEAEAEQAIQAHIDKRVNEVLCIVEEVVIGGVEGIWCDFESDRGTRLCKWCGGYRSAIEHAKWEQHQAIKKLRSEL